MKETSKTINPEVGTFYLLTYDRTQTPWQKTDRVVFVKDHDNFIKINLTEGAGYSSRWDWATQDAVTINKLATNKALVEKLNQSIELGETIEQAER